MPSFLADHWKDCPKRLQQPSPIWERNLKKIAPTQKIIYPNWTVPDAERVEVAIGFGPETSTGEAAVYFGIKNNELLKCRIPKFNHIYACFVVLNSNENDFKFSTKQTVTKLKNLAAVAILRAKINETINDSTPILVRSYLTGSRGNVHLCT